MFPSHDQEGFWKGLGLIVLDGNRISANGANLSIDKSAGTVHQEGINFHSDRKQPNIKNLGALIPITFRYRTQSSVEGSDTTVLDPTVYDNAGVITAIPGSSNRATNVRVYMFSTGNIRVQYGQQWYNTLAEAVANVTTEPFIKELNIDDNAILVSVISITKDCVSLLDTNTAKFSPASKFGEVETGTGASSVSTMQDTYNNGSQPQIITHDANGAIQYQCGTANDSDSVLEILNKAGSPTTIIKVDGS